MGASLVAKVINKWGKRLSNNGFRVVTTMALVAKDRDTDDWPAGTYFGGHSALCLALQDSDQRTDAALKKAVQEGIKEALELGAIKLIKRAESNGRRHENAVYRLTLDHEPGIYKRDLKKLMALKERQETSSPPRQEPSSPPGQETVSPPRQETTSPPPYKEEETQEETQEELKEEEGVKERGPVAVRARDTADTPKSECSDPKCRMGYIPNPARKNPKDSRNIRCPTCHPPGNVLQFGRRNSA